MNGIHLNSTISMPEPSLGTIERCPSVGADLLEKSHFLHRPHSVPGSSSFLEETPAPDNYTPRLSKPAFCSLPSNLSSLGGRLSLHVAPEVEQLPDKTGVTDFMKSDQTMYGGAAVNGLNTQVTPKTEAASLLVGAKNTPAVFTMKRGTINVSVRVRPALRGSVKPTCCRLHKEDGLIEYVPPPKEFSVQPKAQGFASGSPFDSNSQQREIEERGSFFAFDAVLGGDTTQNEIMDRVGRPILQNVLEGFNGTILCYGQSGSGKTHTMLGPAGGLPERLADPDEAGILPRMLQELFARLENKGLHQTSSATTATEQERSQMRKTEAMSGGEASQPAREWGYAVEVSAMEIYKEDMYDLLQFILKPKTSKKGCDTTNETGAGGQSIDAKGVVCQNRVAVGTASRRAKSTASSATLKIRDVANVGVVVEGLSWHPVRDAEEALHVLKWAAVQRHVGSTAVNQRSGRSHLFFYIALRQREAPVVNKGQGALGLAPQPPLVITEIRSLATLVDLAGSERVADTKANGKRLEEARHINLSLTLLGNVIRKLTTNPKGGDAVHIPYRDSKLTRLLQESIGGNAVTALLCTISPDLKDATETLSTLQFAKCAKRVQNRPVVGRTETKAELLAKVRRLTVRNKWLEKQLSTMSSRLGSFGATSYSPELSDTPARDPRIVGLCSSRLSTLHHERESDDTFLGGFQDSLCSSPPVSLSRIVPHLCLRRKDGVNEGQVGRTPASEPRMRARARRIYRVTVFTSLSFAFWAFAARLLCMFVLSVRCLPAPVEEVFIPVADCPACMTVPLRRSRATQSESCETSL
ncbi:kinesin, putative [Trypanosoma equiperdum]|uniref:Kinesin, putative n=1 Tax=Trypanosoma equiperdum TaxID=5694 RepID=A0A1G4HYZ5_TRYEQ|nr:kinesin, putative [Trypanosoma equiperdum]